MSPGLILSLVGVTVAILGLGILIAFLIQGKRADERNERLIIDLRRKKVIPRHDPCVWDDERPAQLLNSSTEAEMAGGMKERGLGSEQIAARLQTSHIAHDKRGISQ